MAPTDGPTPSADPEVPEADALEQAQAAAPEEANGDTPGTPKPKVSFEVPEADALEQAQEVPDDDDRR